MAGATPPRKARATPSGHPLLRTSRRRRRPALANLDRGGFLVVPRRRSCPHPDLVTVRPAGDSSPPRAVPVRLCAAGSRAALCRPLPCLPAPPAPILRPCVPPAIRAPPRVVSVCLCAAGSHAALRRPLSCLPARLRHRIPSRPAPLAPVTPCAAGSRDSLRRRRPCHPGLLQRLLPNFSALVVRRCGSGELA